ncbi:MAG: hypothetical protein CME63_16030 [Halobacteriovoraceae bacterium]|nr:hypothetical protein [Halobacteriovoraceae bacterium]
MLSWTPFFGMALSILLLLFSCSGQSIKPLWMERSDKLAEEFTRDYAEIYPELGSSLGYRDYDSKGQNPGPEAEKQYKKLTKKWISKLEKSLNETEDKNLIVDLKILLKNTKQDLNKTMIEEELGLIPVYSASQRVYGSLFQLINDQSPQSRKLAAVDRFLFYMKSDSKTGKKSLIQSFRSEIERHQKLYKKGTYPFRGEVEKYLSDSPFYVKGVGELLAQSGREDWHKAFRDFKAEVELYDGHIRNKILPLTRKSPMLPRKLYALALKAIGVDADPLTLIKLGKSEYKTLYKEYRKLAQKIADKNKLKSSDPAYVVNFLKTRQVTRLKEVEKLYHDAAHKLEKIIEENKLVTLPKTPLKIRMASDAESKASPVPHLNPPPLINNQGIRPEFVVPTSSTGQVPFNDFSYESTATILTAHEGRPGHDLQFTRMVENPPSIIRARYAMNSVNVEGWALYAEDLVYPYLNLEEKFAGIQMRLWRQARYFLDPMVQLGKGDLSNVMNIFNKELGVSQTMATLEYQRYAFRSPGQATAYFHGYLNILSIKEELTEAYGKMDTQCFNDTLLSFGLLPHRDIMLFKENFKKCGLKSSVNP